MNRYLNTMDDLCFSSGSVVTAVQGVEEEAEDCEERRR